MALSFSRQWMMAIVALVSLFAGCASQVDDDEMQSTPETDAAQLKEDAVAPSDTPVTNKPNENASALKNTSETQASTEFVYHNPLNDEQQLDGWLSLFDGATLFGWESTSDEVNWRVENGVLTADSGPVGFLFTTVPFTDYELVCEYRMEQGGNSGLFLRSAVPPGDIATDCYEVNIADDHPDGYTTGALVERQTLSKPVKRSSDWNEFRITVTGDRIKVQHNNEQILEYEAAGRILPTGRVGLQKNSGKIEFRKVLLKPLNLDSIFDGESLAGWREVPGSESEFSIENEEIHVKNGQGFIETEQTYQDFIFQADAISHAAELNSGYFFRAMPGTEEAPSNGYEFQIHNGFTDDRSQPSNSGTGAIFRRVDARYVVANDQEWFTSTLVAFGPRIACWVNGYQVVDWVDQRDLDPNPRRGKRLEGGHLSIQGHDPTTDLSFRNLKVHEYPVSADKDE